MKKSGENRGKNGLVVVKGVVKRVGEKLGKKKGGQSCVDKGRERV